jgi:hypothetical protein
VAAFENAAGRVDGTQGLIAASAGISAAASHERVRASVRLKCSQSRPSGVNPTGASIGNDSALPSLCRRNAHTSPGQPMRGPIAPLRLPPPAQPTLQRKASATPARPGANRAADVDRANPLQARPIELGFCYSLMSGDPPRNTLCRSSEPEQGASQLLRL